jgi:hypothetical protein
VVNEFLRDRRVCGPPLPTCALHKVGRLAGVSDVPLMLSAQTRLVSRTSQMPRPANPRTGQYRQADLAKSVRMRRVATRRTAVPTFGSSRRALIKTMGVVAAVTTCAERLPKPRFKPQDQKKLTQAAARYQDHPKENESCRSCPYFVFPKRCVLVEGERSRRACLEHDQQKVADFSDTIWLKIQGDDSALRFHPNRSLLQGASRRSLGVLERYVTKRFVTA